MNKINRAENKKPII